MDVAVVAVTTILLGLYPWLVNPNHGGVGLTSELEVGSSGVDAVCGGHTRRITTGIWVQATVVIGEPEPRGSSDSRTDPERGVGILTSRARDAASADPLYPSLPTRSPSHPTVVLSERMPKARLRGG